MSFKPIVTTGHYDGQVGLEVKCFKDVAGVIQGAITRTKLSLVPGRTDSQGNKFGKLHTVPCKVTGECVSV